MPCRSQGCSCPCSRACCVRQPESSADHHPLLYLLYAVMTLVLKLSGPQLCAAGFMLQVECPTSAAGGTACIVAPTVLLASQWLRVSHTASHGCTIE